MKNTTPSLLLPPPLLMVLLLVLSHSPGGSPDPLLASSCSSADIISGVEDVALLSTKMPGENPVHLYVHPEPDFRGVSLVARSDDSGGNGEMSIAWFQLEKECFQVDADWWELFAVVNIRNYYEQQLQFFVSVGRCTMQCNKPSSFSRTVSLQVNSYGPSKWRFSRPHQDTDCTIISPTRKLRPLFFNKLEPTESTCTKPPAPLQCPQSTILVVVVVSVGATVGVLVLVITVIVTAKRMCHRKTATTTASTAVDHTQASNQARKAEPSTPQGYNDALYDDVLNTQAPHQALAMGLGASRDNKSDLYDDVVNFHEDVEAIYDKIEEEDVYLVL